MVVRGMNLESINGVHFPGWNTECIVPTLLLQFIMIAEVLWYVSYIDKLRMLVDNWHAKKLFSCKKKSLFSLVISSLWSILRGKPVFAGQVWFWFACGGLFV